MTSEQSDDLRQRLRRVMLGDTGAAATVGPEGLEVAAKGTDLESTFEIGSISKGITGLLYADAVSRGEVSPRDTLDQHLPLQGCPAGGVTLAALATHSSGLPTLPLGLAVSRSAAWLVKQDNPYGDTLAELIEQVRPTQLKSAKPRYSNIGFQLLGHAVAAAAGLSYRDLAGARIAQPLELTSFSIPSDDNELGPTDLRGHGRYGRRASPWTGEALGPAGGIRMNISDAGALLQALAAGTAPGMEALEPVANFRGPRLRIGAAWLTSLTARHEITWHNGATGGFRTWLGVDRTARTGAVVLRARSASTDAIGRGLLQH